MKPYGLGFELDPLFAQITATIHVYLHLKERPKKEKYEGEMKKKMIKKY